MSLFKTKKKVGKSMVEVEETESDPEDEAGPDEEVKVDDDEEDELRDESRDQEDEEYLDSLVISAENLRKVGNVPERELTAAKRALRKVSDCHCFSSFLPYYCHRQAS